MRTRNDPSFIEQQRRAQIIDAAIALLARSGHAALTFIRIAESAGISPGLITYHFRTKTELVSAIAQTLTERLDRAMTPTEESAGYVEALYAMITGFVQHCAEHPEEMLALRQLEAVGSPADRSAQHDADLAELEQMVSGGQAEGEYRAGNPRTLALTTLAIMHAVPREIAARPATEVVAFADELATAVVHAVADLDRAPIRRRVVRLSQR